MTIASLILTATAALGKAPCEDRKAIWANSHDGRRTVFYMTDPPTQVGAAFAAVQIEEWRGAKLAWRQNGLLTCSNGASTCYVMMEAGADGDRATNDADVLNRKGIPEVSAIIETIDVNKDGLSDWVVLAGLGQLLHYAGGARVEWFNGFSAIDTSPITVPNVYQFYACQKP